jgi:hypothetical protein
MPENEDMASGGVYTGDMQHHSILPDLSLPYELITFDSIDANHTAEIHYLDSIDHAPYTGSDIMGTGYVFTPYIPLQVTPTLNVSELRKRMFGPSWKWWRSNSWNYIDLEK